MIDKITADLITKTYYESVYKFCLVNLKHNTHDAADITQDVFLLFQLKYPELKNIHIRGWLFRTANNKIKEYYRRQKKESEIIPLEDFDVEDESAMVCTMLEDIISFDSENIEKYRDIVYKKLNEREQTLYKLHYVENKTNSQIAEEMNTSAQNVSVMLTRLNKKLNMLEALVLCTVGQLILRLFF